MTSQRLAIARPLSWSPDQSFRERAVALGPVFTVDLFSTNGNLSELTLDTVRVLSAFGRGRTVEQVCSDLGAEGEDASAVAALSESLLKRGFLRVAEGGSPTKQGPVPPSLLVTAHNCGGTLMRFLLDSHPRLACAPPHRLALPLREMMDQAAKMDAFPAMGLSQAAATRSMGAAVGRLLELHARLRQKDGWVWASRDHDLTLHYELAMFGEGARFVVLVRHPLDAAESSAQRAVSEGWHAKRMIDLLQEHDDPRLAYAHYWVSVYRRVRAFRAAHPGVVHVVKYEDLVKKPEGTLGAALAFLGLELPQDLTRAAFTRPHEMLEGGWESFRFLTQQGISSEHVDLHRAWPKAVHDEISSVVAAEMKAWGY